MLFCWPSAFPKLRFSLKKEESEGELEPYGEKKEAWGELFLKQGEQQEPKGKPVETTETPQIPDMDQDKGKRDVSFQEYLDRALKEFSASRVSEGRYRFELPVSPASEAMASALRQPHKSPDVEAIVEAWEAGESLENIAKRLGRGKGEIELILRLWRSRG